MKKCSVFIVVAMMMGLTGAVQQAGAAPGDLLGDPHLAWGLGGNENPDGSGGVFQWQVPGAPLGPDDWDADGTPDGRDRWHSGGFGGTEGVRTLPYAELGGVHSGKNWVNVGVNDNSAGGDHFILSWFGGGAAANAAAPPTFPLPDPDNIGSGDVPYLPVQMDLEVRLLSGLSANVWLRDGIIGGSGDAHVTGVTITPDMAGINDRVSFSGVVWNEWFWLELRGLEGGAGSVVEFSWTQVEVPEPVTMSLLGLGSLVVLRRRRRA